MKIQIINVAKIFLIGNCLINDFLIWVLNNNAKMKIAYIIFYYLKLGFRHIKKYIRMNTHLNTTRALK